LILSAALVLLGGHATSGYTVTDLGHIAVFYSQGISINSHDDVAMLTIEPIYGPSPQSVDTDIDTYVWSNGTTTHIEIPNAPNAKVQFTELKEDGSLMGQVLDNEMSPVNGFTWTKTDGVALTPAPDGGQEGAAIVAKDTFLVQDGIDSTHTLLKTVHHSDVLNQVQVGEFFQPTAINEAGVIIGVDSADGGDYHAVRVDPGNNAVSLDMPPHILGRQATSSGLNINDAGYVVGSSYLGFLTVGAPASKMGAIWAPDGTLTSISDANGLTFFKINNHNQAVGWKGMHRASCAVVYDSVNGLRDLNTLVPAGTPNLISASAINDSGSIVCVSADNHVFLLKPTP